MQLATRIIIETLQCTEAQANAVEFALHEKPGFYWNNATRAEMTRAIKQAAKELQL